MLVLFLLHFLLAWLDRDREERCQAEASQERAATESLGRSASESRPADMCSQSDAAAEYSRSQNQTGKRDGGET